jgi:hypothetical protein
MAETVELYFDGVLKECKVSIDRNGEYLCEAEDGSFAKFPKDSDLAEEVEFYNKHNDKEVEAIEDVTYGAVEVTPSEE